MMNFTEEEMEYLSRMMFQVTHLTDSDLAAHIAEKIWNALNRRTRTQEF